MSANYNLIIFFSNLRLIWSYLKNRSRMHNGCILNFPVIMNFYLTKAEKQNWKIFSKASHYCFEKRYYFCVLTHVFWSCTCACTYLPNFKFLPYSYRVLDKKEILHPAAQNKTLKSPPKLGISQWLLLRHMNMGPERSKSIFETFNRLKYY